MSPDPVLAAIDATLDQHDALAASMRKNANRFDIVAGGAPGPAFFSDSGMRWSPDVQTATGPGWVSPHNVRYVSPEPVQWHGRERFESAARALADLGPVPRPALTDAGPAETTLPNDVPRRRRDWVWLLVALAFVPAFVYAITFLAGGGLR